MPIEVKNIFNSLNAIINQFFNNKHNLKNSLLDIYIFLDILLILINNP